MKLTREERIDKALEILGPEADRVAVEKSVDDVMAYQRVNKYINTLEAAVEKAQREGLETVTLPTDMAKQIWLISLQLDDYYDNDEGG